MTALDVAKSVALKVGLDIPTVLFSSTDRTWVEMSSLLNEVATEIAEAYDWQLLKTQADVVGDGASEAFALPSDYERMLRTANVWSSPYLWGMEHVVDTDRWLDYLTLPYRPITGAWTIYGGSFRIIDTLAVGQTAKYMYISNLIVSPASGVNKPLFTADDDTFRLNEKLLQLRLTSRWKEAKNYPSQTDLDLYQMELASQMEKDGGSKPIFNASWSGPYGANGWWR